MTTTPIGEDNRWLDQAGRILSGLGFDLIDPDALAGDETTHLLACLRPAPTMRHFDPEAIDYWTTEDAKGKSVRLDREAHFPVTTDYAWGQITLMDRLGVTNQFLSFGGTLRAAMTPDAIAYVDFSSRAPIVREAGHSQSVDPIASELGAFFARLKVPIDFVPGAEALLARAAPRTLYCAFIQNVRERLLQARGLREANRWLADWTNREGQRMDAGAPEHWTAATELRKQLGAMEVVARE